MQTVRDSGTIAVLTTADQVVSSASNALLIVALATTSSADLFGLIGLLVAVVMVCLGFNRGALGTPLLLTSHMSRDDIAAEAGYALSWAFLAGLVAGAVVAVGGAILNETDMAWVFGLSIPFVLAQDVLRIAVIALGRPGIALVADSLWTTIVLAVIVAGRVGVTSTAPTTVLIWGGAGLLSGFLIAIWARLHPRWYRIFAWWRTYYPSRLRFGALPAAGQVGGLLVSVTAFETVGGAAAAGIRGALTLFGPITVLISALPMVFVPHSLRSRSTAAGQWRTLVWTSVTTSALTLSAAVLLLCVPEQLGNTILGQSWAPTRQLVPFIGIECAAAAWRISGYTFFQSRGVSRAVFQLSLVHLVFQAGSCLVAGLWFQSAIAIGVAVAVSGSIMALAGQVAVHMWLRSHRDRDETHR
ncbi:MAG: hypothetical protein HYZ39_02480 [Mycolicibacterium cosmeticum]|nr:hypothetical protein [Mycolicibacterium cosmeticum]